MGRMLGRSQTGPVKPSPGLSPQIRYRHDQGRPLIRG
jgi:hypothetical protein